jgi:hypothetical protein
MDLIVPCIGMKLLTSQSRTPTTTKTSNICIKGIGYLFSSQADTPPVQGVAPNLSVDLRTASAGWSGREPAISSVVQAEALGLFALVLLLASPTGNILEGVTRGVCSLVHTSALTYECVAMEADKSGLQHE